MYIIYAIEKEDKILKIRWMVRIEAVRQVLEQTAFHDILGALSWKAL